MYVRTCKYVHTVSQKWIIEELPLLKINEDFIYFVFSAYYDPDPRFFKCFRLNPALIGHPDDIL